MKKTTAFVGAVLLAGAMFVAACGSKSKKEETLPDNKGDMKMDTGGAYGGGDMGGAYGGAEANPCGDAMNPCG